MNNINSCAMKADSIYADSDVKSAISTLEKFFLPYSVIISVGSRSRHQFHKKQRACEILFKDKNVIIEFAKSCRLIYFAQKFISCDITIYGNFDLFSEIVDTCFIDKKRSTTEVMKYKIYFLLTKILPYNFKAKLGIQHYSIPGDAYSLFLDSYMQYTCALFHSENESLEQAQINKLEHIFSITDASKGCCHLDVGCGWGGLIRYFTGNFSTISTGITNSDCQYKYSIKQNRNSKNANFVNIDFFDYKSDVKFDLITVVGMLEHIPESMQKSFFSHLYSLLKPGGKAYIQCITKSNKWIGGDGSRFLNNYVYTGYHIEYPDVLLKKMRTEGLNVTLVEDGSKDYSLTTKCWSENLEKNREEILKLIPERDFRIFFGYITIAKRVFSDGRGQLTRFFLSKPL